MPCLTATVAQGRDAPGGFPSRRPGLRSAVCRISLRALLLLLVTLAAAVSARPASAGPVEKGIWLSLAQIQALPMSGTAWSQVKAAADGSLGTPKISDHNSNHDVKTLAVALAYARTGNAAYRSKAADAIMSAIGTETGGGILAVVRNLASYVIAADLINLREYSSSKDATFRSWLSAVRTKTIDGTTLVATHEKRANNFGTHAGASRVAADLYLGDSSDLARAAAVFRGWLGDRTAYAGFDYGELAWQADPSKPVGVNPAGAVKSGHSIDGVLPDDQRRGGGFTWPPPCESYVPGALQGALVEAELLTRAGYPAWEWSTRALYRAMNWYFNVAGCRLEGNDQFEPWLVNAAYGSRFPTASPIGVGKNMAWTDWTHARSSGGTSAPPPSEPPPPEPSPTPAPGGASRAFAAAADAMVKSDGPTRNFGAESRLRIRNGGSTGSFRTYLTFTVSGLSGSPRSVKLRLYVSDPSPDTGSLYRVASSWSESTITWSNAPAVAGVVLARAGSTTAPDAWVELDLTGVVTGNGTYSFALTSSSSNSAFFSSREGGNAPQLVLTL